MWFIGVEVEQEKSVPPPKKNGLNGIFWKRTKMSTNSPNSIAVCMVGQVRAPQFSALWCDICARFERFTFTLDKFANFKAPVPAVSMDIR